MIDSTLSNYKKPTVYLVWLIQKYHGPISFNQLECGQTYQHLKTDHFETKNSVSSHIDSKFNHLFFSISFMEFSFQNSIFIDSWVANKVSKKIKHRMEYLALNHILAAIFQKTRFLSVSGRPLGFREKGSSDSNLLHRITYWEQFFEKLDVYWLLLDQAGTGQTDEFPLPIIHPFRIKNNYTIHEMHLFWHIYPTTIIQTSSILRRISLHVIMLYQPCQSYPHRISRISILASYLCF